MEQTEGAHTDSSSAGVGDYRFTKVNFEDQTGLLVAWVSNQEHGSAKALSLLR